MIIVPMDKTLRRESESSPRLAAPKEIWSRGKILTPPKGTQGDVGSEKQILTPPKGTPLLVKERGGG
jgi:hypothetical protein